MFDGDAIEAEFKEVYAKILAESAIAPDVFLGEVSPEFARENATIDSDT